MATITGGNGQSFRVYAQDLFTLSEKFLSTDKAADVAPRARQPGSVDSVGAFFEGLGQKKAI